MHACDKQWPVSVSRNSKFSIENPRSGILVTGSNVKETGSQKSRTWIPPVSWVRYLVPEGWTRSKTQGNTIYWVANRLFIKNYTKNRISKIPGSITQTNTCEINPKVHKCESPQGSNPQARSNTSDRHEDRVERERSQGRRLGRSRSRVGELNTRGVTNKP